MRGILLCKFRFKPLRCICTLHTRPNEQVSRTDNLALHDIAPLVGGLRGAGIPLALEY
jgi:hypothetical protein